ncbi:MAG: hypothetical protein M3O26_16575 [Pseudomonadota bacterium]|nr:hypothetical protein [Pseudomonadota bacterium]
MRQSICTVLLLLTWVAGVAAEQKSSDRIRAFAKLPDWSGIWSQAAWPMGISGRVEGGEAKLREGLQLIRQPPYNAEWLAKYAAGVADTAGMAAKNATFTACTRSFPALMESPWMFQVIVLPEETVILFENGQVRHIYTDGRPHPSGDDVWPVRLGDSIGRWEGDVLRIDTIARDSTEPLAPRAWVSMLSAQAQFTERLRLIDADTLEDQMTIEDPVAFAAPWHVTLKFDRQKAMSRLLELNCTENDRNPVVDGKMTIRSP